MGLAEQIENKRNFDAVQGISQQHHINTHADSQQENRAGKAAAEAYHTDMHTDSQSGGVSHDAVSSSPEPVAVLRQNVNETPDSYTSYWVGAKARALDDAAEPFMPAAVSESLKSADTARHTASSHIKPDRYDGSLSSQLPGSSSASWGMENKADTVSEILTPKAGALKQEPAASSISPYAVKPAEQGTEQTQTDPRALSEEMLEYAAIHEIEPEIISDFEDWEG